MDGAMTSSPPGRPSRRPTGSLGTAVATSRDVFRGIGEGAVHLLVPGTVRNDQPFMYLAGAGWSRSGDGTSRGDWDSSVASPARLETAPLRVPIGGTRN
jgi:hypothetical protein